MANIVKGTSGTRIYNNGVLTFIPFGESIAIADGRDKVIIKSTGHSTYRYSYIDFNEIDDKFGTADAIELVEYYDENNFFGDSSSAGDVFPPVSGLRTVTNAIVNGVIPAGKTKITMLYRGNNGTLNGVNVPNNFAYEESYQNGETLPLLTYTVPLTGEQRIIIVTLE